MSKRSFFVLFADDMRREIGDKKTLVGIYSGILVVGAPVPTVLPQIAMMLMASGPLSGPPIEFIAVSVRLSDIDDELGEKGRELVAFRGAPKYPGRQREEIGMIRSALDIVLGPGSGGTQDVFYTSFEFPAGPINVEKSCRLVVRVETEQGLEHTSSLILITQAENQRFDQELERLRAKAVLQAPSSGRSSTKPTTRKRQARGRVSP